MKLKDLIQRTSLRNRKAGDFELPETHVFEITDLLIPAGTDYSDGVHPIGNSDLPAGSSFLWSLYLESIAAVENIFLVLWWPGGINDAFSVWTSADSHQRQLANGISSEVTQVPNPATTGYSQGGDDQAGVPFTVTAGLVSFNPSPIHVVRARAAFQVI